MRFALVIVALAALLAQRALATPNCVDSTTVFAQNQDPDSMLVCLGPCHMKFPTCTPQGSSFGKYEETLFFTTFAAVNSTTVYKLHIMVDDSSYQTNFLTGATQMSVMSQAIPVTLTRGSDGIIGHPFNRSVFIVSDQWAGIVTLYNTLTDTQTQVPTGNQKVYGTFHMMVTQDLQVGSPTFGKYWLMAFSGKMQGWVPSFGPQVPVGWVIKDDGSLGAFHVFSVIGPDDITQIVEIPDSKTGRNAYMYTSAPPGGGGYYGRAFVDFNTFTVTELRLNGPGLLTPTHGALFDYYTSDMLMFGKNQVAQVEASAPASPSFGSLKGIFNFPHNSHFDQGAPDGNGHVFIADNDHDIVYLSYVRSRDVSNPESFGSVYTMPFLDDVAPLSGGGRVCPSGTGL